MCTQAKTAGGIRDQLEYLSLKERNLFVLEHALDTDCKFIVGPEEGETKEIKAHRFLLCSASAVFRAMLPLEAKTAEPIRLTDLSPNTFQLLLRFVYADETKLTTFEEARDVALAADIYRLNRLLDRCLSSMANELMTPDNVWSALKFLHLMPDEQLKQACFKMMQMHTKQCLAADDFLQADEDHVALLLEQDDLDVETEVTLMHAAESWATHEAHRRGSPSARDVLQPRLLTLLRLLSVSPVDFARFSDKSNLLTLEEKWKVNVCMLTQNCDQLPKHLCPNLLPRNRPNPFFCVERKFVHELKSIKSIGKLYVSVKCDFGFKLLGFKMPSKNCTFISKADSSSPNSPSKYEAKIMVKVDVFESPCVSSSDNFVEGKQMFEFEYTESVEYQETISILFPQPIVLNKENWLKITTKMRSGRYANAELENEVFYQDALGDTVKVKFFNYFSINNGIFTALIFTR